MQQTYRIFLASSYELKADREQFEIFINRQNNALKDKGVFLHLVLWEDIGSEVYPTHKQDHYNRELKTCDIFVMLYWSKVGKYTNIEFERALGQFRYTEHNPKMYVFEKKAPPPTIQTEADKESLAMFGKKLTEDGIFSVQYNDSNDLTGKFKNELDKLFKDGYLKEGSNKYTNPAEPLYTDGNSVPSGFIGRDIELKTIKEKLDRGGGSLMLINAEGGIGKTSLAAKYWEESLYDYRYNAWLFCEEGIIPALKKLAPKLKVDLAGLNEKQQTEAMKQALMSIANDTLLVLDNANKAEDINDFIKIFRGLGWHVLLTSRCHGVLEKAHELHIEHLPPQQAKEIFESNYKEDTSEFDALLDRLLAAIGYHTLLTEIFSKNLAELKDTGETLAKFLNDLEIKGLFLEARSFNIKTDYPLNIHKDVETTDEIIEILYDFNVLQEQERYFLVNLALLAAVNYELNFLSQLFEPVNIIALKKVLDSLFQKGWINYAEKGYKISPVIQKLVLYKNKSKLHKDSGLLVKNLSRKLANDGLYLTNLDYAKATAFIQLIPVITKNLKDDPSNLLAELNDSICLYYQAVGDLLEAQQAAEKCEELCKALGNSGGLSISYSRLGDIFCSLGYFDKALDFYKEENALSKQLLKNYPTNITFKNGLAISFEKLGNVYINLDNYEEALHFYKKENVLKKQIYKERSNDSTFKNGLAVSYLKLGDTYRTLGEKKVALNIYSKSQTLFEQLFKEYPNNLKFKDGLSVLYHKIGILHFFSNDTDHALDFFLKYNEIAEQLNNEQPDNVKFKNGLAISYSNLGDVYKIMNEIQIAKDNYLRATTLLEELADTSPRMAEFQKSLTNIRKKINELDD